MNFKNTILLASGFTLSLLAISSQANENKLLLTKNSVSTTAISLPTFSAADFQHLESATTAVYTKMANVKAVPQMLAQPDKVIKNHGGFALVQTARAASFSNDGGLYAGDVMKNQISGGLAIISGNIAVKVENTDNLNKLLKKLDLKLESDLGANLYVVKAKENTELNQLEGAILASNLVVFAQLERLENLDHAF